MGSRGFGCAGIISLAPLGARAAGLEHLQGRFFGASFLSPLFRRHLIRGHRGDFYWRLGVETERSGVPYRESKPSAHRHRTARTTRQINGAKSFLGQGDLRPIFRLRGCHENTSRASGELLSSFRSFQQGIIMVFVRTSLWTSYLRFILTRNYNGFVVDMDSLYQVNVHFSKELQWFRCGPAIAMISEPSFQQGITMVSWWTWILQFK